MVHICGVPPRTNLAKNFLYKQGEESGAGNMSQEGKELME